MHINLNRNLRKFHVCRRWSILRRLTMRYSQSFETLSYVEIKNKLCTNYCTNVPLNIFNRICLPLMKFCMRGKTFDNLWHNSLRADEYLPVSRKTENCSSFSYFSREISRNYLKLDTNPKHMEFNRNFISDVFQLFAFICSFFFAFGS